MKSRKFSVPGIYQSHASQAETSGVTSHLLHQATSLQMAGVFGIPPRFPPGCDGELQPDGDTAEGDSDRTFGVELTTERRGAITFNLQNILNELFLALQFT